MIKLQKILLLEDDEITSFLNKTIIESTNLADNLVFATNGQEGIEYLQSLSSQDQYPELILMDLNMPILDGFGFLEELQKLPSAATSRIRIVALSTSSHPEDMLQLHQLGVTTCLEKPLTESAIKEVISSLTSPLSIAG